MLDDWMWHGRCDLESLWIFSFKEVYKILVYKHHAETGMWSFNALFSATIRINMNKTVPFSLLTFLFSNAD